MIIANKKVGTIKKNNDEKVMNIMYKEKSTQISNINICLLEKNFSEKKPKIIKLICKKKCQKENFLNTNLLKK